MTGAASWPGGRRVSNSCSGQRSAPAGALFHHHRHIILLPPVGPQVHDGHLGGDSRALLRTEGAGTRGPHTTPGARGLEPPLLCPPWPEPAPGPPALFWAPTLTLHEERLVWPALLPPTRLRPHRPRRGQLICPPERLSRDRAPQGEGPGAPKTTAPDSQWMDRSFVFLPVQDLLGFESIFNIKYLFLVSTRVKWKIKKRPRLNYTEKGLRRLLAGLTAQGEC